MIDLSKSTPDERVLTLGPAWRDVFVRSVTVVRKPDGGCDFHIDAVIDDAGVTLIGDPDTLLEAYRGLSALPAATETLQ